MNSVNEPNIPAVGIYIADAAERSKSGRLARMLHIPLVECTEGYDFILSYLQGRLSIFVPADPALAAPVYAEFVAGPAGYRRRRGGREKLLRAIGLRGRSRLSVVDATGGLGKDSFLMAASGCRVHILERDRIIAALLEDGLQRAAEHPGTKAIAARISVTVGDSIRFLDESHRGGRTIPDVVYLDPMYPERSKSSLVKKEMQLLQKLVGHKNDSAELLKAALTAARSRVVVKRPKSAAPLGGATPSHALHGKTTRFDVYMIHRG